MTDNDFSQFVQKYEKLVFTICYHLVKDYHEAQNLSQETFLSAYRHIDNYQGDNYKPWIARIATNKAKDFLGSAYSRKVFLAPADSDDRDNILELPLPDTSPQPDEEYISKESTNSVEKVIRSLREPYQKVCVLYFLEEKSTEEISLALGRPKKTVDTQLYRAKSILQNRLKEEQIV